MTALSIAGPGEMLRAVRDLVTDADDALLSVAFANQAGVELLAPALQRTRGSVRLLATTVFGDTTGAALRRAVDLGVEVRVLNPPRGTYHPKLYLARAGSSTRALVGSANLTSGMLRNIEVGVLLTGAAESEALRRLRALAEGWWRHPATAPWTDEAPTRVNDVFLPDLWDALRQVLTPGAVVHTLSEGRPNRVVELARDALWIETERSARLGRGAEPVPAWMLNVAWDHLAASGRLTNRYLLSGDGLNVKRSSAVCAILATLPQVAVASRRPIELALNTAPALAAAEQSEEFKR